MIYVLVEDKYDGGDTYETFVDLIEGDGDAKVIADEWSNQNWEEDSAWRTANPTPAYVAEPKVGESWDAYIAYRRALVEHCEKATAHKKQLTEKLGATKLEALLKAGFKLVPHGKVDL